MAISHFKLLPLLFLFHFKPLLSHPSPSFSFTNFDKDPNFESTFSLYGDAKVIGANGSSSAHIQLTHSVSSSGGRVMYKKPIRLLQGSTNFASFSTYFSFLMSPDNSLALILVPGGEFNASVFVSNSPLGISLQENRGNGSRIVAVEYGALEVAKYGGFVSVNVRNLSSASTMLSSGKRLHSWVDYQAGSKRLEIRLSQFGEVKPLDSLLSYPIDLSRMWSNDQEVLIGLSSSNGNASQSSFLYSWSFQLRQFPHWMHSQPLDPEGFDPKLKPVVVDVRRRGDCGMKVIAALIMGVGFGALGAFMGVNLCNMLSKWKRRLHVGPEECSLSSSSSSSSSSVHPVDFEYEKVKVVAVDDKVFKDGK